jgi:hypothetical protein
VVVLLLAPRLTRAVAGACVQAAVVAAMLAPFALAGTFRMFDHEWRATSGTLVGLVVGPGAHFGWPLRLAQPRWRSAQAQPWRSRGAAACTRSGSCHSRSRW